MKLNAVLTYLVCGVTAAVSPPVPAKRAQDTLATLPGLSTVQSVYARSIIARAKADGVPRHGCEAAITTSLVESSLLMCANNAVPASFKFHNDRISSDHDSVGIFQQRASVYSNVACNMDAGCSAGQFFSEMKRINGWQTMDVGTLCQKIQLSSSPDRYAKHVPAATSICAAGGL